MSNDTQLQTRPVATPAPGPDRARWPVDGPPDEDEGRLGSVFWTSVGISALFVCEIGSHLPVRLSNGLMNAPAGLSPNVSELVRCFVDDWRNLGDLFWRALGNYHAATRTAFGTHIYQPVGVLYNV